VLELRNEYDGVMRRQDATSCRVTPLPVMAFIPVQELECVYEPEHGFERGTMFPELDKPWLPGGKGGCCRE
jgi:hypothetical protein